MKQVVKKVLPCKKKSAIRRVRGKEEKVHLTKLSDFFMTVQLMDVPWSCHEDKGPSSEITKNPVGGVFNSGGCRTYHEASRRFSALNLSSTVG